MKNISLILSLISFVIFHTIDAYAEHIEKLSKYREKAKDYFLIDEVDSCAKMINKAIELADENDDIREKIDLLCLKSLAYQYTDPAKSNALAKKAKRLASNFDYSGGIASALSQEAFSLSKTDIPESIIIAKKAVKMGEEENKYEIIAFSYFLLGENYYSFGNYNEALKYFIESLNTYEKKFDPKVDRISFYYYGQVLNSLGITYKTIKRYEDAIHYYRKYHEISIILRDTVGIAIANNNLGNIYKNTGKFDEAMNSYSIAEEVFREKFYIDYLANVLMNKGNLLSTAGLNDSAMTIYNKSLLLFKESSNNEGVATVYTNMADIFVIENKLNSALSYYTKSWHTAVETGAMSLLMTNANKLSEVYKKKGDYKNSLEFHIKYTGYKDSLFSAEKERETGEITANFEMQRLIERKEAEESARQKIEAEEIKRRNMIEYGAIFMIVVAVFSMVFIIGRFGLSETLQESIAFVALLLLFEFILVILEPFQEDISGGKPIYILGINLVVALMFTPFDTWLEKYLRNRVSSKEHN